MSDPMKALLDTRKHETLFLTPIRKMLLGQDEFGVDRRHDVVHPSELADDEFCPLALYYRLSGWEIPKESNFFQLEVIFAQGHGYHDKYQNWAWKVGTEPNAPWGLRGRYRCLSCMYGDWSKPDIEIPWMATSPIACPSCGAGRLHLQYGEVPLRLKKYRIAGKADGDIDLGSDVPIEQHPLLEIKSVGEGTIRKAAPKLLSKHTKKVEIDGDMKSWTDWAKLWRDIKRPFRNHVKQGTFYSLAKGRERMLFVYEFKPTGASKEFEIKVDPENVAEELDTVLDVLYAVKKQRPPDCPHDECDKCEAFEKLRDGEVDEEGDEPEGREDSESGESEGEAGEEGTRPSRQARRRDAPGSRGSRRPLRLGTDGGTEGSHDVGRSSRRRTRTRGDHGGERSDDLRAGKDRDAAKTRTVIREGNDDRAKATRKRVIRSPRS